MESMMDYKKYAEELREQAAKFDISGLSAVANEYRKAADAIKELLERNRVQAERIKEQLYTITKLEQRLHDTESELKKLRGGHG
jgi:histidinol-phosphate/aromatic aminotransferase/cobyric acid decarboxylase-like protein